MLPEEVKKIFRNLLGKKIALKTSKGLTKNYFVFSVKIKRKFALLFGWLESEKDIFKIEIRMSHKIYSSYIYEIKDIEKKEYEKVYPTFLKEMKSRFIKLSNRKEIKKIQKIIEDAESIGKKFNLQKEVMSEEISQKKCEQKSEQKKFSTYNFSFSRTKNTIEF